MIFIKRIAFYAMVNYIDASLDNRLSVRKSRFMVIFYCFVCRCCLVVFQAFSISKYSSFSEFGLRGFLIAWGFCSIFLGRFYLQYFILCYKPCSLLVTCSLLRYIWGLNRVKEYRNLNPLLIVVMEYLSSYCALWLSKALG
jgi:hypothetical protein